MRQVRNSILMAVSAVGLLGIASPSPAQAQSGTQFVGQISPMGFGFCPRGWASTDGQLLAISTNQALFSLLGTSFGGDGRTTFGLPDLRGRVPVGYGASSTGAGSYNWGQKGGSTQISLTVSNLPSHTHTGTVAGSPANADTRIPVRNSFAASTGTNAYLDGDPAINNMHPDLIRIDNTGGNQAVNKVSPYTTVNWCIALQGIYPSRS